jgi:fructose-1-phosphate kinase PfkB-like protein
MVDVPAVDLRGVFKARLDPLLFIKPNQTEFEGLIGKSLGSNAEIAREACRLLSRCEMICVSLAQKGAILVWNEQAWLVKSPPVRARGTVGSGDSMVGAVASYLVKKGLTQPEKCHRANSSQVLEALRWGVAAGAATATTEGTSLGKASLIRKLYPKVTIQRIRF